MSINYLEKLEYPQVLEKLSTYCVTNYGKEKALNLKPANKKEEVLAALSETEEAVNLIYKNNTPAFSNIADNTVNIKILEVYGTLSIKGLLELNQVLKTAETLKKYFSAEYIEENDFPKLSKYFQKLYTNPSITKRIEQSIEDENTISDEASQNLKIIRKKQRKLEQDIKNKLNNMIHSSSFSKYIQENVVTIRNDRYVIPVKEEYRGQIKGLIHDVSSSGSTIFIEPISIFEANNELNNLKMEENIEIEKILADLSKLFYPYNEEIKENISIIGTLDFIFAKAKYSRSINGTTPKINTEKHILLKGARHPLIPKENVVANTITLGKDYTSLVITGPNTGGKTVTLKTVGLLVCMTCSGLNIPAEDGSSIFIFDQVFADIGDDQSISDSLSTFSSHMTNSVEILKKATSNSLVLVDELGSGTDPVEGAMLAIGILEELQKIGTLTISTTHYQELKKYALVTNNFENASVEFNINTLTPTYKLFVGVPGKSNAFEISKKLGLKEEIIQNAKSRLTEKDINFEEVLKQIYEDRAQIEKEKEQIHKTLEQAEMLKKDLEDKKEGLIEQENKKKEEAKREAREILLDAKEEASRLIKEMEQIENDNTQNAKKQVNQIRNELNNKIKGLSSKDNMEEHDSAISKEMQEKIKKELEEKKKILKPNMDVYVKSLQKEGITISYPSKNNEVQVQFGNIKMAINVEDIEIKKQNNNDKIIQNNRSGSVSSNISKSRTAKTEINVIGLNVEEATFVVDKFLDDASLAKLSTVRIVHGKGTGKLRDGIHQFLKKNPHVASYRMGTFGEGEMGVTVVELK